MLPLAVAVAVALAAFLLAFLRECHAALRYRATTPNDETPPPGGVA